MLDFWRFAPVPEPAILTGEFDPVFVVASWLIAALAGYSALSVKDLIANDKHPQSRFWLPIGAVAMGVGIWAMHFTGMLAFHLPVNMGYHPVITAASGVPAIAGSAWALKVLARPHISFWSLQLAGLLLAAAIGTMHYLGMEAMTMEGVSMAYDFRWFCGSILVAHILATLALTSRFALQKQSGWHKVAGAALMGLAVCGMHYTAMAAAIFYRVDTAAPMQGMHVPHDLLALVVIATSVMLLTFVIFGAMLDRRLLETESNQGALIEVLPDGFLLVDPDLQIIRANPAADRIFGFSIERLAGRHVSEVIPGWQQLTHLMIASLQREQLAWGKTQDGNQIALEVTLVPQISNKRALHVVLLRDVTERRAREASLRRLGTAVEQTQAGIVMTDASGAPLYWNQSVCALLGEDRAQIQQAFDFIFQDSAIIDPLRQGKYWQGQWRPDWTGDQGRVYTISATPVINSEADSGAEALEFLVTFSDVSEQDRLETRLRHAQKLESIGQLASGIAHEINTPVQYVADNVSFLNTVWDDLKPLLTHLKTRAETDDTVKRLLEEADLEYLTDEVPESFQHCATGLEQIKKIVLAMKKFAHPGEDQKEPSSINELIENTAIIARNEYKYIADLEFDFAEDLASVDCVRSAVNQVLLNMIVNAAHAIEDRYGSQKSDGRITVSTRNQPGGVEIRIRDNGAGMPEEVRRRIFDPFYTTKEVGRGSGQGLAIAHNVVVETHGGVIDVESTQGEGTTFIIRLPHPTNVVAAGRRPAA